MPVQVRRDHGRAGDLVAHRHDRGGGGKFLTVYPERDDAGLRELAAALHRATLGLPGPAILSDRPCFPGSLVHYRYGVFGGVPALGDDGIRRAMLVAPDGRLVPDRRRAWFAPPAWAPRDPFTRREPAAPDRTAPVEVLLDGRFLVHAVIRHAFGGGVFRGVDESTGAPVIIKQARPHTAATLTGRDARDLRPHEAAMLEAFAGSGFTPAPVALFVQQGDLFLVQEAVDGVTLRQWVRQHLEFTGDERWGVPAAAARPAPPTRRRWCGASSAATARSSRRRSPGSPWRAAPRSRAPRPGWHGARPDSAPAAPGSGPWPRPAGWRRPGPSTRSCSPGSPPRRPSAAATTPRSTSGCACWRATRTTRRPISP
ncbi:MULTISPECIES: hypothetical protein [unclassified Streptomyces]|uniref:class III lanthionine synthetase LanKC N-terminal domain-containing protein n=1 Tax=unclassified Streptomyces TaxID=2593676 RepID=UPI0033D30CFF